MDVRQVLKQAEIEVSEDGKIRIADLDKAIDAIAASDWSGMHLPVENRLPNPSMDRDPITPRTTVLY